MAINLKDLRIPAMTEAMQQQFETPPLFYMSKERWQKWTEVFREARNMHPDDAWQWPIFRKSWREEL